MFYKEKEREEGGEEKILIGGLKSQGAPGPPHHTVNSNYDDKTEILLFLRAFKLFSQQF